MSMFAMSDVTGITISTENGGCGQPHELRTDDQGHKVLDCAECGAATQRGNGYGFATHHGAVPATPDEIAEHERLEKEATRLGTASLVGMLRGVPAPGAPAAPQPSLLEQLRALSPEDKAALRDLLGPDEPATESAPEAQPTPAAAKKAAAKKATAPAKAE